MSISKRRAKAGESPGAAAESIDCSSINQSSSSSPTEFLGSISEGDWQKLSSTVSLARALIEYEIRECQEVFANNPNEESLNYWRDCLKETKEAAEILTQFRVTAQRRCA